MKRLTMVIVLVLSLAMTSLVSAQDTNRGELRLEGLEKDRFWHEGESHYLYLTLSSETPVTFVGQAFSSDCGLILPGGFVTRQDSDVTLRWYVTLPAHSPRGLCTITAPYYVWPDKNDVKGVRLSFVVKK